MALFTNDQKIFIVTALGFCKRPRIVVNEFAVRYPDTVCIEQDVSALNPSQGALLSPDLHQAWTDAREYAKEHWRELAALADKGIRVLMLHYDAMEYRANGNIVEARAVMRQIAEEMKDDEGGGASDVPTDFEYVIVDPKPDADSGTQVPDRNAASVSTAPNVR